MAEATAHSSTTLTGPYHHHEDLPSPFPAVRRHQAQQTNPHTPSDTPTTPHYRRPKAEPPRPGTSRPADARILFLSRSSCGGGSTRRPCTTASLDPASSDTLTRPRARPPHFASRHRHRATLPTGQHLLTPGNRTRPARTSLSLSTSLC